MIYTLGYGQLVPAQVLTIAEGLDAVVVDVRGRPVSRRPGFGRRQLETLLGARYEWQGDQLGGLHHLADARAKWPDGLRRMLQLRQPLVMLCQCHAPGVCHRHQLALELHRMFGTDPVHLFYDAGIWEATFTTELQRSIEAGPNDEYECFTWSEPSELLAEFEGE